MLSHYAFAVIALSFAAGILIGMTGSSLLWALVPLVAGVVLWFVVERRSATPAGMIMSARWHSAWVMLLFISAGMMAEWVSRPTETDFEYDRLPPYVYGRVVDHTAMTYGDRVTVDLEGMTDADGKGNMPIYGVRARLTLPAGRYSPQQRIVFVNGLKRVEADKNRQYRTPVVGAHPVLWRQTVREGEFCVCDTVRNLRYLSENIRNDMAVIIGDSGLQRATSDFICTLLLGFAGSLDKDTRAVFAEAGISHILAVSGMHLGIISSLIYMLTAPLILLGKGKWRYPAVVVLTWIYVFVSGFHISAVRAAIMVTVVMAAAMMERKYSMFNILCFALFIILLADPRALLDIGLQLSFVCVGTLVAFGGYFSASDVRMPAWLRIIYVAVATSLIAVFGSWALTACYFGTMPLMFIPVNMIVLPLLPVYMLLALLHIALSAAGIQAGWIVMLLDSGYTSLLDLCAFLTEGTVLRLTPGIATPLLWCAGLGLLAWGLHTHRRNVSVAAFSVLVLAVAAVFLFPGDRLRDGIIVRNYSDSVVMGCYRDGEETETRVPIGDAAIVENVGKRVYVAGADVMHDVPKGAVIVVTSAFRGSAEELVKSLSPAVIVIHPSVCADVTDEISSAAYYTATKVWRLEDDGPLQLLEP